jgi:hypothetical protein
MRFALVFLLAAASAHAAPEEGAEAIALVRTDGTASVLIGQAGEPATFTGIVPRQRDGHWGSAAPIPTLHGVPFMLRDSLWTASVILEVGGRHSYLISSSDLASQLAHRVDPVDGAVAWAVAPVDHWTLLLVEELGDGALVARRIVGEGAAADLEVADMFAAGTWPAGARLMDVDAIAGGRFVAGGLSATGIAIVTSVDEAGVARTLELPSVRGGELAVAHAGATPMVFAAREGELAALRLDGDSASEPMTMPLDAGDAPLSLQACSLPGDRALLVLLVRGSGGVNRLIAATSDGRSLTLDGGLPESMPVAASAPPASARERIATEAQTDRLRARIIGGAVMGGLLLALLILMMRLAAMRR